MRSTDTIIIASKAEKWRLECPHGETIGEGHKDWRVWNGVFCCQTCKRLRDAGEDQENVYEHLRDTKTGELVTRDQLEFTINVGQPQGAD